MKDKCCFFIGHREASENIYPQLLAEVRRHIEKYVVKEFVVGHYGNFDRLAARAVIEVKKIKPEINLTMLLPYYPTKKKFTLPVGFDGSYYPHGMEKIPKNAAIVRANRYMIDNADYLIAYVWHPASNARNLLEYAEVRKKSGEIKITLLERE